MSGIASLESDLHQEACQRQWAERGLGAATGLAFGMALCLPAAHFRGYSTIALAAIVTVGTTLSVIKATVDEDEWLDDAEPDPGQIDWGKPEVRESLRYAPRYLLRVSDVSAAPGPSFEVEKACQASDNGKKRFELGNKGLVVVAGGVLLGWVGVITAGLGKGIQGSQIWHTKLATLAGSVGSASAAIWLRDMRSGLAAQRAEIYYRERQAIVGPQADKVQDTQFLEALKTGVPEMDIRFVSRHFKFFVSTDSKKRAALDKLDNGQLQNLAICLADYRNEDSNPLRKPIVVVRDGTQLTLEGIQAAFPDDPWKQQGPVTLYLTEMSAEVKEPVGKNVGSAVIAE